MFSHVLIMTNIIDFCEILFLDELGDRDMEIETTENNDQTGRLLVVENWERDLAKRSCPEIIQWAASQFGQQVAFASSLGAEDQVISHFISQVSPGMRIFTLDTGRLFPETYELIEATEGRYNIKIQIFVPSSTEVESMVSMHGVNLFYKSTDFRKLCCSVRKIHPLGRALAGMNAWICGLRRDQALTRQSLRVVEWDEQNNLYKINPLWNWSEKEVWDFIREWDVPYNPLHDRGFLSIGCSCCTRAVSPGEDIRAGRWWWENPEHKECGLHLKDGKLIRS